MVLSVVVPTLNGRTQLSACLDALAAETPESELVVVNGPSADGTTGMVRERDDVDVLVEVADRNLNVARNAGIEHARGDRIALVGHDYTVEPGWFDALTADLDATAAVRASAHTHAEGYASAPLKTTKLTGAVTGPMRRDAETRDTPESRTIAGRAVTYFDGSNVAFTRAAIEDLDGFDEYLRTGGARDVAHRLAASGYAVAWASEMCVRNDSVAGPQTNVPRAVSDGGHTEHDWHWKYRALAYRLVKNYGVRPTTVRRLLSHAGRDAFSGLVGVARGEGTPSGWAGNGRDVLRGTLGGEASGLVARWRSRRRHNPNGLSSRSDRAVEVYDWR